LEAELELPRICNFLAPFLESSEPELIKSFFEAAVVEANEDLFWQFRYMRCCIYVKRLDLNIGACNTESTQSVNKKSGSKLAVCLSAKSALSINFIALDF